MTAAGRIMIVDGNENLRMTMERVLTRKGHEVTTVSNAPEAIKLAEIHHTFDLIFMDAELLSKKGDEINNKLKQTSPNAVLIQMTSFEVEDLVHNVFKENSYRIINEPLEIHSILSIIDEIRTMKDGLLILVASDSIVRNSFKGMLERKGLSVAISRNMEEALQVTQNSQVDVLLIDSKLPTIDDLETHLAVRKNHPKTVSVLITGYPSNVRDIVEDAMQAHSISYLHKPLDMIQVFEIIDEILLRKEEAS